MLNIIVIDFLFPTKKSKLTNNAMFVYWKDIKKGKWTEYDAETSDKYLQSENIIFKLLGILSIYRSLICKEYSIFYS